MSRRDPNSEKPSLPLEELTDRGRKVRGEDEGEETLSSAEKAPAPEAESLPEDDPPDPTPADQTEPGPPEGRNREES